MKIIDTHCHLADCRICELDNSESDIYGGMEKNNISMAILQPFPGVRDVMGAHKRIAKMSDKYPGKIYGIVSINPHCDEEDYIKNVESLLELGCFVGIKLHTLGHVITPVASDAKKIYKTAEKWNLPVMVHTGLTSFGDPANVIIPAKKYKNIVFILAHSGWSGNVTQAIAAAISCDNIYLETSWTSIDEKSAMLSMVGSGRMMLGSDTIPNMKVEITQYKELGLSNPDLNNVFHKVAEKVYNF